jgi:ABC-type Mn2+/Zn2+ transport system permease subunit
MLIDMLQFPFMQRAFLGGTVIALLLGWLGVFVITRKMSFVGDGVAHASLAAVSLALLVGWAPLPTALIFSAVLGYGLFFLNRYTSLSSDTSIGLLFTFGMALGIILLQYHEGYAPELISFLFGSILGVTSQDLLIILSAGIALLTILYIKRKEFAFLALDPEGAALAGISRDGIDLLYYVFVSASVVLSIKLIGVVLVSAILIIPSSIGKILGKSFAQFQWISIIMSVCIVWAGLLASYMFDWPSGSSIVLTGILFLACSSLLRLRKPR